LIEECIGHHIKYTPTRAHAIVCLRYIDAQLGKTPFSDVLGAEEAVMYAQNNNKQIVTPIGLSLISENNMITMTYNELRDQVTIAYPITEQFSSQTVKVEVDKNDALTVVDKVIVQRQLEESYKLGEYPSIMFTNSDVPAYTVREYHHINFAQPDAIVADLFLDALFDIAAGGAVVNGVAYALQNDEVVRASSGDYMSDFVSVIRSSFIIFIDNGVSIAKAGDVYQIMHYRLIDMELIPDPLIKYDVSESMFKYYMDYDDVRTGEDVVVSDVVTIAKKKDFYYKLNYRVNFKYKIQKWNIVYSRQVVATGFADDDGVMQWGYVPLRVIVALMTTRYKLRILQWRDEN